MRDSREKQSDHHPLAGGEMPATNREPYRSYDHFYQKYHQSILVDDRESAFRFAIQAAERADHEFSTNDLRIYLSKLMVADIAQATARPTIAETYFKEILALNQQNPCSNPDIPAFAAFGLTETYLSERKYALAYQLAEKSLSCLESIYENSMITPRNLQMALAALHQGKTDLASQHIGNATFRMEEISAETIPLVFTYLKDLALAYQNRLAPADALQCALLAQSIIKKSPLDQEVSSSYAEILDICAHLYLENNLLDKAHQTRLERLKVIRQLPSSTTDEIYRERLALTSIFGIKGEHERAKELLIKLYDRAFEGELSRATLLEIKHHLVEEQIITGHWDEALETIIQVKRDLIDNLPNPLRDVLISISPDTSEQASETISGYDSELRLQIHETLSIYRLFLTSELAIVSSAGQQEYIEQTIRNLSKLDMILGLPTEQSAHQRILISLETSSEPTTDTARRIEEHLHNPQNRLNMEEVHIRFHMTESLIRSGEMDRAHEEWARMNELLQYSPHVSILPTFSKMQCGRAFLAIKLGETRTAIDLFEQELVKYDKPDRLNSPARLMALSSLASLIDDEQPERAYILRDQAREIRRNLSKMNPSSKFDFGGGSA